MKKFTFRNSERFTGSKNRNIKKAKRKINVAVPPVSNVHSTLDFEKKVILTLITPFTISLSERVVSVSFGFWKSSIISCPHDNKLVLLLRMLEAAGV